jgi:hypothetical protein
MELHSSGIGVLRVCAKQSTFVEFETSRNGHVWFPMIVQPA